jgi:putative tricarboxylic transport membrane protein
MLMPLIIAVCSVGMFSFQNDLFDVVLMLCFGLIGYSFERLKFPVAPMILGLVLGEKAEFNLRTALKIGRGDYTVLVTHPISIVLASLTVLVLVYPIWQHYKKKRTETR